MFQSALHSKRNLTSDRRLIWLASSMEVLLGFALLVRNSGTKSLWLDEALTLLGVFDWQQMWAFIASAESGKFWLHHLPAFALWHTGASEFWFRSYSLFFAVAAVPVTICIGKLAGGYRVGLSAGLLLAVSPAMVVHGQETRMYAMLAFFTALGTYLFIRAGLRGGFHLWLSYGLVMALALATHLFAVLIIATHVVAAIPRLTSPRFFVGIAAGLAVTISLTAAITAVIGGAGLIGTSQGTSWIPPSTPHSLLVFALFATGQILPWWGYAAIVLIALAYIVITFVRHLPERWPALVVWMCALLPLGATFAISVLVQPVMLNRYLIVSLVPSVLVVAMALRMLQHPLFVTAATLVFIVRPFQAILTEHQKAREDWRGATTYVVSQAKTGDVAVFVPDYVSAPFEVYSAMAERRNSDASFAKVKLIAASDFKTADWQEATNIWLVVTGYPSNVSGEDITSAIGNARVSDAAQDFVGVKVIRYRTIATKP